MTFNTLKSFLYKFQINQFLNNRQYILSLTTKLKTVYQTATKWLTQIITEETIDYNCGLKCCRNPNKQITKFMSYPRHLISIRHSYLKEAKGATRT